MPGWLIRVVIPGTYGGPPVEETHAAWIEDPDDAIAAVERDFNPEEAPAATCVRQLADAELSDLGIQPNEAGWLRNSPPGG